MSGGKKAKRQKTRQRVEIVLTSNFQTCPLTFFFSPASLRKSKISFHLPLMSSIHNSKFSGRWKEIFEFREVLGDEKTKDKVEIILRGQRFKIAL